jgi:L-ascorbate metabolism protein UlaG (beta-lactamase superfamily)
MATARDVAAETARMLLRPLGRMDWRRGANLAKRRPIMLQVADRLGRDPGRTRFFDHLNPPPPAPSRPDLDRFLAAELAAAWLGHATLLFRISGKTILTDPVFSHRVGLGLLFATIGPKRRQQPALSIDELPPIDLILSSHAHFDHLDRPSLWRIARRFPGTPVIAAAGTSDLLHDLGFGEIHELDWEQFTRVAELKVSAIPVKHWGPRVFYDDWRGFNAYLIEDASARILFGGDSAHTDAWAGIGPVDLLAVGISAYNPFIAAHASPEQAWEMAQLAGARQVLPMHHTTFKLSHEPLDEPLRRFLAAAGPQAHRVAARQVGDVWIASR